MKYTYTVSEFVCLLCLQDGVAQSAMSDKSLQYCNLNGTTLDVFFTAELSVEDKAILDSIVADVPRLTMLRFRTKQTDDISTLLIETGFVYQTVSVPLDLEHQIDYKVDYDVDASILPYPRSIKGNGSAFITFNSREEHSAFYYTGMGYIRTVLSDGWKIKYLGGTLSGGYVMTTPLANMTLEQLQNWTDPRV